MVKINSNKSVLGMAIAVALGVTACGGGNAKVEDTAFGTLSGTAAKGIIKQGLVEAFEMNADGTDLQKVGSASTDATGAYELKVAKEYTGGPIRLNIVPQAGAKMVCDVHDVPACPYGTEVDLPTSFQMESVLPEVVKDEVVTAQITPLTHMAASRAKASGVVDKDAVKAAVSEISQLAGVNVLEIKPVDITKSDSQNATAEQLAYAAFAAGVGKVAFEAEGGLDAGLNDLATSFADGKLDSSDKVSITEIVAKVRDEAAQSNVEVGNRLETIEARVGEDGSFDPEPLDGGADDVAKAKVLISDVRTWVSSLAGLESPAEAFAGDVKLASNILDQNTEAQIETLTEVLEAIDNNLGGKHEAASEAGTSILDAIVGTHVIPLQITASTEEASPSTVGDSVTVVVTGSNTEAFGVSLAETGVSGSTVSLSLTSNIPAVAFLGEEKTLNTAELSLSASVSGNGATFALEDASFNVTPVSPVIVNTEPEVTPTLKTASINGDAVITQSNGGVDYSFAGKIVLEAVGLAIETADNEVGLKKASLSGTISSSVGDQFSGKVELDVRNPSGFDTFGFFDYDNHVSLYNSEGRDVFGIGQSSQFTGLDYGSVNYNEWQGSCFYGGTHNDQYAGDTGYPGDYYQANGEYGAEPCQAGDVLGIVAKIKAEMPEAEDVEHVWFNYNFGPTENGTGRSEHTEYGAVLKMPDLETTSSFFDAKVTLTTDLSLRGLPASQAVISADRKGFRLGEISLSVIQDDVTRFNVTGTIVEDGGSGSMTFTNTNGASLVITLSEDETKGVISVDGESVGTIGERAGSNDPIIFWANGDLESLI